jgi:hypothetical protein
MKLVYECYREAEHMGYKEFTESVKGIIILSGLWVVLKAVEYIFNFLQ